MVLDSGVHGFRGQGLALVTPAYSNGYHSKK